MSLTTVHVGVRPTWHTTSADVPDAWAVVLETNKGDLTIAEWSSPVVARAHAEKVAAANGWERLW